MLTLLFITDTPTTVIYTLSLHDALPIYKTGRKTQRQPLHRVAPVFWNRRNRRRTPGPRRTRRPAPGTPRVHRSARRPAPRSEEHTSELQSRGHLVCRLLLEKKKEHRNYH